MDSGMNLDQQKLQDRNECVGIGSLTNAFSGSVSIPISRGRVPVFRMFVPTRNPQQVYLKHQTITALVNLQTPKNRI